MASVTRFGARQRHQLRLLLDEMRRQLGEDVVEERLDVGILQLARLLDRDGDLVGQFADEPLVQRLVPDAALLEMAPPALERIVLDPLLRLGRVAIGRLIVGRRMLAATIGDRFDQRRSEAGARPSDNETWPARSRSGRTRDK